MNWEKKLLVTGSTSTLKKFIRNFNKDFTLELMKFIQENIYFTFNDIIYKQLEGTATGKSQAPQYANLTLAYLVIEKLCPLIEEKYESEASTHIKEQLLFFLDDGFMTLNEKLITAAELLNLLNSLDIKFAMN